MDEPSDEPPLDDDLDQRLSDSDQALYEQISLHRTITKVVTRKLQTLFPGEFIPEFRNLEDAREMLGDASEGRDQRYYQAGRREGMAQGAEALLLHMRGPDRVQTVRCPPIGLRLADVARFSQHGGAKAKITPLRIAR